MTFILNNELNTDALRERFTADGYVHVPAVLEAASAGRIHRALAEQTRWNLVFADRGRHIDLSAEQVAALPGQKLRELQQAIYAQARESFQYCYYNYPIYDAHRAGRNTEHLLHRFYEWLNADEFLEFARAATGFEDIAFLDAQATCYRQGHFLTCHDDSAEGKHRRAAYIFNFTPRWIADWGGYLQLLDDDDGIRRGLSPAFNALNIVAVPQRHNVSLVAPFAGADRLSITGWMRYGDPEA